MGTRALHLEGWEGISYRNLGITKNITFGAVFIPYGSLVDGGSLFGHYQYSAREDVASVDWGILSNGSVWRARVTVGGVSYIVSSTTAAAGQSRLALFGVREGDNLHIYVNGRLEGTTTGLGSGTLDTDFTLYLGADSGSAFTLATAGTNADFEMLYVCEHALPAPAIMELSRINPFALIRPARPSTSRFVPSAGFTTVLIKPASAAP
jgi:hypothetical protein